MPTAYPGALDNWANPGPNTTQETSGMEHDVLHSNVQDAIEAIEAELGLDPSDGLVTVKARLDLLHRAGHYVIMNSGQWYGTWITPGTPGTIATVANRLYVAPLWLPVPTTFDRIGVNVTVLQAGSTVRLGLYNAAASFAPSSLIVDAGTVDSSTTGTKEVVVNQTLTTGFYWLAAVPSAAVTLTNVPLGSGRPVTGSATVAASPAQYGYGGPDVAYASALPDPCPALTYLTSVSPLIQARMA